jgi:hypothetical protein
MATDDDKHTIDFDIGPFILWPRADPPCLGCKSTEHGHLVMGANEVMCPDVAKEAVGQCKAKLAEKKTSAPGGWSAEMISHDEED